MFGTMRLTFKSFLRFSINIQTVSEAGVIVLLQAFPPAGQCAIEDFISYEFHCLREKKIKGGNSLLRKNSLLRGQ